MFVDALCDADDRMVDSQASDRKLLVVLDRDGPVDGCSAKRMGGMDAPE